MAKVCRVCLDGTVQLVDIFAGIYDPSELSENSPAHIIGQFAPEHSVVSGDSMPQFICLSCIKGVQTAYHYKVKLEQGPEKYRKLCRKETKPERCRLVLKNISENEITYTIESSEEDPMHENESHENAMLPEKSGEMVVHYSYDKDQMCVKPQEEVPDFGIAIKEVNFKLRNPQKDYADNHEIQKIEQMPELAQVAEANLKNLILEHDPTEKKAHINKNEKPNEDNKSQESGTNNHTFYKEDSLGLMDLMDLSTDSEDQENDSSEKWVKSLECKRCGKVVSREENLGRQELGMLPFVCNFCGFMNEYHPNKNDTSHKNKETPEIDRKPLGMKNTHRSPSPKKMVPDDHNNDRQESISPRKMRSAADLPCPQCSKCFDSQDKLEYHIEKMCHKCPKCSRFYVNERSLSRHLQTHTPTAFKSTHFPRSVPNMDELMDHRAKQSGDRKYKCQKCNTIIQGLPYFQAHIKEHTNGHDHRSLLRHTKGEDIPTSAFEYPPCPSSFPNVIELIKHHHCRDCITSCQECCAIFVGKINVQIHRKEHTKEQGLLEHSQRTVTPSLKKPIDSDVEESDIKELSNHDASSFSRSTSLVKKVKSTDDSDTGISSPPKKRCKTQSWPKKPNLICQKIERPFQCTYCDKAFTRKGHLNIHTRLHTGERPFQCTDCEMAFSRKCYLIEHSRIHTGELPFKCSICIQAFRLRSERNEHTRAHSGERPFQCTYCPKKLTRKDHLKEHIRLHTGERPYECSACDMKFRLRHRLTAHYRTHTGEKPFECTQCGKHFSTNKLLAVHKTIHTGVLPYECSFCNRKFRLKFNLDRHIFYHTDKGPYICRICKKEFKEGCTLNLHLRTHTCSTKKKDNFDESSTLEKHKGKESNNSSLTKKNVPGNSLVVDDIA